MEIYERETPWIGDGYGIFVFEEGKPTEIYFKHVLNIYIDNTVGKKDIFGKISITMIPRKNVSYPLNPSWLLGIKSKYSLLPDKTNFGYLVFPNPHFVKFKNAELNRFGVLKLEVDRNIEQIIRDNKVNFVFEYELDLKAIKKAMSETLFFEELKVEAEKLIAPQPISFVWSIMDFQEKAYLESLSLNLKLLEKMASTGGVTSTQFMDMVTKTSTELSELAKYSVLILVLKNETANTFLESKLRIDSLKVYFSDIRLETDDIIVPEELRDIVNINYGENYLEILNQELDVNEELRIALTVSNRLLKELSSKKSDVIISIEGDLPDIFDFLTTGIKRSSNEMFSGLIYVAPMGYPVTRKNNSVKIPLDLKDYPI